MLTEHTTEKHPDSRTPTIHRFCIYLIKHFWGCYGVIILGTRQLIIRIRSRMHAWLVCLQSCEELF